MKNLKPVDCAKKIMKENGFQYKKMKTLKDDSYGTIVRFELPDKRMLFSTHKPRLEPLQNFYNITLYIQKTKKILTPRPLVLSKKFNIFLYEGLSGKQLLNSFKNKNAQKNILDYYKKMLAAIKDLHGLPLPKKNVLAENRKAWIREFHKNIKNKDGKFRRVLPKQYETLKRILELIKGLETKLYSKKNLRICHGDLDADNVIVTEKNIGLIDFTDVRLTHPADDYAGLSVRLEMMAYRFPGQYHECQHDKKFYKKLDLLSYTQYYNFCSLHNISHIKEYYLAKKLWWYMRMYSFFGIMTKRNILKSQFLYTGALKTFRELKTQKF